MNEKIKQVILNTPSGFVDRTMEDHLKSSSILVKILHDHGMGWEGNFLDLGCGNGRLLYSLPMGRDLTMPLNYTGLDIDKKMIEYWQKNASDEQTNFVHLDVFNPFYNPFGTVPAEKAKLPFDDNSFDEVVAFSVFTHMETHQAAANFVSEIARVLVPGGKLFSTWFKSPPNEITNIADRTVYDERFISMWLSKYFKVEKMFGGESTGWNDQLMIYGTLKESQ